MYVGVHAYMCVRLANDFIQCRINHVTNVSTETGLPRKVVVIRACLEIVLGICKR